MTNHRGVRALYPCPSRHTGRDKVGSFGLRSAGPTKEGSPTGTGNQTRNHSSGHIDLKQIYNSGKVRAQFEAQAIYCLLFQGWISWRSR
jgi:hypothetical protein